jgi:hypothetical protein
MKITIEIPPDFAYFLFFSIPLVATSNFGFNTLGGISIFGL